MTRTTGVLGAVFAIAGAMPATTLAQVQAENSEQDQFVLEEILVTAQKREERLIETPLSVTVLTADALDDLNVRQLRDFASTVPALSYTSAGAGQSQLTLRGVTAGHDIGPTVGVYVDDVPYGSSSAFSNASSLALDVGITDLERIEVLRGPQGTLYGASTMGGLLKYVSTAPDRTEYQSEVRAGVSSTRHGGVNYDGGATLNAPFASGKAALRANGFYAHEDGYVENVSMGDDDVGGSRIHGGRLDLLVAPTDALTVRLVGFAQNIHRDGTPTVDLSLSGERIGGEFEQRRLFSEPFDQQFRLASATVAYEADVATLTSITSYQTSDVTFRQDASAVYVPALGALGLELGRVAINQDRSVDKFTQEIRLGSNGKAPVQWLVGAFYTDENSGNGQLSEEYDPSGAVFPLHLATVSIPSTYEEIAGFGNVTVQLGSRLSISGGLRYAENRQRFEQIASGALVGSTPETSSTDDVTTYLANARYEITPNASAYVRYATGYRPGGPNFVVTDPGTGTPLNNATFEADTLDSYEIGLKANSADRGFAIEAAAYRIDWSDVQVSSAAGGVSIIDNAGRARIDGGELTLTGRAGASITATGAFAYQRARLIDPSVELGAVAGERLPNVPKLTAALSVDYRSPSEEGLQPTAGATLRYIDERTASFNGSVGFPQYRLPSYAVLDLRSGITIDSIDLHLYVRNVLDRRGQLSAETFLSAFGGPAHVTLVQPRTVGISATARF
jgi:outer membrane receptor protein involved in Fe transport